MTEILLFEMPVSITEDELREALVRGVTFETTVNKERGYVLSSTIID